MAKLKLDLHPIFNDGARIEAALDQVLREAEEKRIPEVEIIPGKGSGALKKTVLRFLARPEVRAKYHRVVKDGDNWGRLFVYFRWEDAAPARRSDSAPAMANFECFCCGAVGAVDADELEQGAVIVECPSCGSPNRLRARRSSSGMRVEAESGYE